MRRGVKIYLFIFLFYFFIYICLFKDQWGFFPGDSVVKNPPANAGDTGSIPDLGKSHILWSN